MEESEEMKRWKAQIDQMVATADAQAKERLKNLSQRDKNRIRDLAQDVRSVTSKTFKKTFNVAGASATGLSSSYSISTLGVTGLSVSVLGIGLGVDGVYLAMKGGKKGANGFKKTFTPVDGDLALKHLVAVGLSKCNSAHKVRKTIAFREGVLAGFKKSKLSNKT